ncbi:MAG: alpha/beta hydrolase [Verrucomicrobiota bacterium]|nr:alpha/beta hydrolase [Verrucomicrobiota bacterium]
MFSGVLGAKLNIFRSSFVALAESLGERQNVESLSILGKEEVFSSKKYFAAALVTAAIAAAIFPVCFPAAIGLFAVASWCLWSAVIIVANRATEDTCLEKPIHCLHAIAMEVNSVVAAAALFPLTLLKSHHAPQGNAQGRPILMVNGYLSFGSTWYYQKQRLVQAGLGPIYTMNVGSGRSIKTYAKQVQEKVEKIQTETGRKDIALIGHSKGGLVSAYYATCLADPEKTEVTDVITIASPLAGTSLAYFGPGYDAYEMKLGSEFHRELRNKIKEQAQIRFSHIASETDEVVPLSSALLVENRSRQLTLKDMGHLGLVFSSRVADQVCAWLK